MDQNKERGTAERTTCGEPSKFYENWKAKVVGKQFVTGLISAGAVHCNIICYSVSGGPAGGYFLIRFLL